MSAECLAWAIRARMTRSSTKNLLMIVADLANHDTGEVFASLAYLEAHTGLSKKTVIAGLQELESEEIGVLERTAEMRGRSGQIPVYLFHMSPLVPLIPRRGGKLHRSDRPVEKGVSTGGKTPPAPVEKRHTEPRIGNQEEEPDSPPSLREGHPQQDLLGNTVGTTTALTITRPSIIEHVKQGWEALAERYTRIPTVRAWNDSRKKAIARRADEVVHASGGALDAYQVWDQIFAAIAGDQWLRGESDPGKGYDRAYVVEIDHVLRTGGTPNFLWILERATTNDRDNRLTSDPSTGRRLGPAEQATHAALARIRAARERREGGGDRAGHNGR